jgi:mxaA protein
MTQFKRLFYILASLSALALMSPSAFAIDSQNLPDINPAYVYMKSIDPVRLVGYTVGDVIEREVILTVKAPYKLIETSLPIPGYEKRHKGQVIGIELKSIQHTKKVNDNSTTHDIKLAYQVFTNNIVAKNAALGPEYLNLVNLKNNQDVVKFRIPTVDIAISPIAIFGQVKIENNMSPFLGPLLLNHDKEENWFKISLSMLTLSALGLVYILGMRAWLPRMGGTFAKVYRSLRKQEKSTQGLKDSVALMHTGLSTAANFTVFSNNLDQFLALKPNFIGLRLELEQFFNLSRRINFEPKYLDPAASFDSDINAQLWVIKLARRCRDCERGLIPETIATPFMKTSL